MKRLTVHISNAKTTTESRKNKKGEMANVPVRKNTLAFEMDHEDKASSILEKLKEDGLKITKHYLSNIK